MSSTKFQPTTEFWIGLFMPLMVAAIIVPLVLLRAWVLATLCGWYVVPAFGVQPLRMVYAFGLALLATYTLPHRGKDEKTLPRTILDAALGAVVVLVMGWIGTLFI